MAELNMQEMEEVTGGVYGGYEKKPAEKKGCIIYRIQGGDTLTRIASAHGTTVQKIMSLNPSITDAGKIRAGFYIYLPA